MEIRTLCLIYYWVTSCTTADISAPHRLAVQGNENSHTNTSTVDTCMWIYSVQRPEYLGTGLSYMCVKMYGWKNTLVLVLHLFLVQGPTDPPYVANNEAICCCMLSRSHVVVHSRNLLRRQLAVSSHILSASTAHKEQWRYLFTCCESITINNTSPNKGTHTHTHTHCICIRTLTIWTDYWFLLFSPIVLHWALMP